MKKLIFPLLSVLLLWMMFTNKCSYDGLSEEFKAKQDSLNNVVDSLKKNIGKRDSKIDSLYLVNAELDFKLGNQQEKIVTITKWIDLKQSEINSYTEQEIISYFNQRFPEDTVTNLLPLAQPVLVSAAKELVELDGARQTIEVKDKVISLMDGKIILRDRIIDEFEGKETDYKNSLSIREKQIDEWKYEYLQINAQNKKLKLQNKLIKIGGGVVVGGLLVALIAK